MRVYMELVSIDAMHETALRMPGNKRYRYILRLAHFECSIGEYHQSEQKRDSDNQKVASPSSFANRNSSSSVSFLFSTFFCERTAIHSECGFIFRYLVALHGICISINPFNAKLS